MAIHRFGEFTLRTRPAELRRGGRRVAVQELPLRALIALLESPGQLVTRDALFRRLWPDDTTGILDDNLNTVVRKLRRALRDSTDNPRFIQTVPRHGYCFIAPVVSDNRDGEESPAAVDAGARKRRWPLVAAFALVVVAVAVWLAAGVPLRESGAPPDRPTVAVLPFEDSDATPENRYFGAGLAEDLVSTLARYDGLRVVSRTSAFSLDRSGLDARAIGRLLGAGYLVEGTVRRAGDRLRIAVHLVEADSGYETWAQTYDRQLDDVLAVQQEIAGAVARQLQGELLPGASATTATVSAEAYDDYLQGRFYWHRRTEEGLRLAADYFQAAIDAAPDYAPAWAGLADAWAVLGFYDYVSPGEAFPRAQAAARRALALDPADASAVATLGYAALYHDWDIPRAEAYFGDAVALQPGHSKAHQWYANLLTAAGRFDEAEREMRLAQQLDPLSLIANAALGWVLYFAGEYDRAMEQLRLTLALDADFELAYLWSGWVEEARGDLDAAAISLAEAVRRSGGSGISRASLARLHALSGRRAEAGRILGELADSGEYQPAYEMAKAHLGLGQPAQAIEWLQRALEQRSHSMVFLRVDPQLAALHGHPDFERIAASVRPDED